MAILQRKKKQVDGEGKSHFYHRFAQQELAGWSPVVTAKAVVIYFFVVACVCVALGVPVLIASLGIVQYSVRYDNQDVMAGHTDQARPPARPHLLCKRAASRGSKAALRESLE
jgi:hypothetical protein